ncbi:MAG: type II toxin-antitoxin system VapB family antitoxin [Chloroflexota bacterium]
MRTTVVLDDELVAEAREVLGGSSLRSMIENSLREAIKARHRQEFIRALETGELELDLTLEQLREWRKDRFEIVLDDLEFDPLLDAPEDAPEEPSDDSGRAG